MKTVLVLLALTISVAHAFEGDYENYDSENFNVETARDVLDGGEASDEFLAAKEALEIREDRANLSDEEAALMMLTNSGEMN